MFTPEGYEAGYDLRCADTAAAAAAALTLSRKLASGLLRDTARSPVYWALASVDVFPR